MVHCYCSLVLPSSFENSYRLLLALSSRLLQSAASAGNLTLEGCATILNNNNVRSVASKSIVSGFPTLHSKSNTVPASDPIYQATTSLELRTNIYTNLVRQFVVMLQHLSSRSLGKTSCSSRTVVFTCMAVILLPFTRHTIENRTVASSQTLAYHIFSQSRVHLDSFVHLML